MDRCQPRDPPPSGSRRDLRPAGREDAGGLLHRRVLQPRARRRCSPTVATRGSSCRSSRSKHAVLGGMDEAIAILKLCSHDWDALTVHALYDGDRIEPWETVMTIEGDYTLFAHLETVYLGVLARRTLDRDERRRACSRRRTASRSSSCRRATTTTASRPATATPRTSRARRSARDRRDDRRAGLLVGRARRRHRPARADRGVRRQHGARRDEVRRVGARRLQHHRAGRLRERLSPHLARGRPRARPAALGRAARHLRPARRPLALGRDGRLRPARRQRAAGAEGARRRSTATASSA